MPENKNLDGNTIRDPLGTNRENRLKRIQDDIIRVDVSHAGTDLSLIKCNPIC
jgi:hypothetical protein